MELSQATLKGLQVCGSSSVDESTFTILLRLAIQSAVQDAYQSELFGSIILRQVVNFFVYYTCRY
jgi:chromatin segregation and condensation protein Rec8/ScpA/Scc1 (kleisin family)